MPTTVVLADDVADMRWLLRNQLELQGGYSVIGEAGNGRDAVEVVTALDPDVVVLDHMMPVMTGLDAALEIQRVAPRTKIVLHSAVADVVLEARRALPQGVECVRKGGDAGLIVLAVARAVAA
ncbi:MAG: response regulator [Acidimicrobiia bacterium]|nr:response regulator [Acidimicrobiia bacterium]